MIAHVLWQNGSGPIHGGANGAPSERHPPEVKETSTAGMRPQPWRTQAYGAAAIAGVDRPITGGRRPHLITVHKEAGLKQDAGNANGRQPRSRITVAKELRDGEFRLSR
jgi:hypothetical protein